MNSAIYLCLENFKNEKITISRGDGIGPEIMDATLAILAAAGAKINYDEIEIGEKVYLSGNTSGIDPKPGKSFVRIKFF